ncbi:vWA domain-containing protein [Halosimplex pelagicum]|uniref:VWA domain-containing protein n=1 Tax=Halosimplex pelagicum TaxID=869886 RepID=A0A7D5P6J7_9EURY|nr:VWA domain-containing protein [Halosimplex pelagicum]QLH82126.1 VWA domain-containing protein [Halosimplex pelagicum]
MSQRVHDTAATAADLTPPEAAQVRTSRQRAASLKQYIEGLLPSQLAAEVDVVITEQVSTAAVLPATAEALLDGEETDFDRQQAKQLVERVNGDYLVLVTGREADTSAICLSDQLTADTAHQFGLAFHETLHILKTSFGAVQTLVEDEVEDQYQEFVHELINIGEDGAIEHEAQTGDDFTEKAGNRLTLVREMHSQTVADLPSEKRAFSFGDALLKALHDEIIFPTGVTEALLDDSDSRVGFQSADGREAFVEVHPEIESLRDDLLALRSDRSDRLYDDDREASLQRAKRIVAFWQDVLKPLIENGHPPAQQGASGQQQGSDHRQEPQQGTGQEQPQQGGESTPGDQQAPDDETPDTGEASQSDRSDPAEDDEFDCPECDESFDSDHGRRVHYGQQHGDTDDLDDQLEDAGTDSPQADAGDSNSSPSPDGTVDPEDLSLETENYDNPLQSVGEHPSVDDEPDPADVDDSNLRPVSGSPDTDADDTQETTADDGPTGDEAETGSDTPPADAPEAGPDGEPDTDPGSDGAEPSSSPGEPPNSDDTTADGTAPGAIGDESSETPGSDTGDDGSTSASKGQAEADSERGDEQADPETTSTASSAATSDLASHTDQSGADDENQQATFGDFTTDDSDDTDETGAGKDDVAGDDTADNAPDTEPAADGADSDGATEPGDSTADSDQPDTDHPDTPSGDGQDNDEDGMDFDPSGGSSGPDTPTATDGDSQPDAASTLNDTDTTADDSSESATETTPSSNTEAGGETDSASATGSEAADQNDGDSDNATAGRDEDTPDGPAHAGADLEPEDFAGDRQRATRTAEESTIDEQGLEEDLQSLESALGDEAETAPDGDDGGGDGAGPGSVDELTILPDPEDGELSEDWQAIERSAGTVADTLAKELRLDQQTSARNGLSSGTQVNTKTAYRLNHNDPRTFSETLPGEEKEYFVVFVLDRSSSMGPGYYANRSTGPAKIDVATSAVARFAVACEDLDIDVAIIDFYDEEARYVKPPSVEAEFAQQSILNTDNAGGTPLSDALSLARTVADADAKESLIITITDDKPADVEDVETQIKASYAPVCSLTIATDCEFGNPPAKAERLEKTYDQTTTVYDPSKLEDRIDQLASLLGAY